MTISGRLLAEIRVTMMKPNISRAKAEAGLIYSKIDKLIMYFSIISLCLTKELVLILYPIAKLSAVGFLN